MQTKEDRAAYMREWYGRNPDKVRAYNRNPKRRAAQNARLREDRKRNPDRYRGYELRSNHGIGLDEWRAMLDAQSGGCAICGTREPQRGKSLHVDHCHETGEVRGILCTRCNNGLGDFRDDSALLAKAIAYLRKD